MPQLSRRTFLRDTLAGTAALGIGGLVGSKAMARDATVILGGGPTGALAAQMVKQTNPHAHVLLVERDPSRLSSTSQQTFGRPPTGPTIQGLQKAGVEVALDDVSEIDWRASRLFALSGRAFAFDRLILAPGTAPVDEGIPGLDARARHFWPAAWGSAREAQRLEAQLMALPDRGHVVVRLPAALSHPEVAADRVARLARHIQQAHPTARLTVLDGGTEPALRDQTRRHMDRLHLPPPDWYLADQGGTVLSVDADLGRIETVAGPLTADVVNFVSRTAAGTIARQAGLTDESGWCPTNAQSCALTQPQTLILGDARRGATRTLPHLLSDTRAALQS